MGTGLCRVGYLGRVPTNQTGREYIGWSYHITSEKQIGVLPVNC